MNTSVAFVAQVSAILMGFFTRVVFTRMLSEGYVGINGLFTDILNILSLSELGVGTAITYALYVPIAKGDIKKQQILMRMFRTFYRMTALFVMAAGLCLIPFLDILMKEKDVDKHNQIVLAMIRRAAAENDVVVLAQGSMITLLPYLNEMPAPVLTSPRLGIERAWAMLQEKG